LRYALRARPDRRLFARLAVFAGTWTVETAASVVDPDGDLGIDLLPGLESLVDKSLVRIEPGGADDAGLEGETRFGLQPLLREYALERIEQSGERPVIDTRFGAAFVALAEKAGEGMLGAAREASMR